MGVAHHMDFRAALSLLGLPPGSAPDAIRDAYRDLAKVWHPDRFTGDPRLQAKASERMRELNEAYRIASSPEARANAAAEAATASSERGAHAAEPPRPAAADGADRHAAAPRPVARTTLPFDTIWRAVFWAGVCGLILFIVTAPEGFFARGRGRAVARDPRPRTAEAIAYARLPESEMGEATLISRVRGTWVVAEHDRGTWLPAGTRLDVQRGSLSCAPPAACDASLTPNGASRLTVRGAAPDETREVDVLFASPTSMLWLVRPAGNRVATPARIVLEAQGEPVSSALAP